MSNTTYHAIVVYNQESDTWYVESYSDYNGGEGDIYSEDDDEWRNAENEIEEYYDKASWNALKSAVEGIKAIPRFGTTEPTAEPDLIY
jgi:hypothetical protein